MELLTFLTKQEEIYLLAFFISCFTFSVILSVHSSEPSDEFMILIISFTSSFEINKVNLFPAFRAPFSLIFLANLFIAFEAKLLTNPGKLSLAKAIATIARAFLLKLPSQEARDLPD